MALGLGFMRVWGLGVPVPLAMREAMDVAPASAKSLKDTSSVCSQITPCVRYTHSPAHTLSHTHMP
jgi:hypothetical protein